VVDQGIGEIVTLPITNAMSTFLELLDKRLTVGVLTTEDSIR
jgi:hypothetical protein